MPKTFELSFENPDSLWGSNSGSAYFHGGSCPPESQRFFQMDVNFFFVNGDLDSFFDPPSDSLREKYDAFWLKFSCVNILQELSHKNKLIQYLKFGFSGNDNYINNTLTSIHSWSSSNRRHEKIYEC